LLHDHRVLRLSRADRAVLLSLYLGADEHGRFNADEMSLRVALGFVDGEVLSEPVSRLNEAGLVHLFVYEGTPFGVIDRWDEDLGADIRRRRPASSLPDPPPQAWAKAKCDGTYKGGTHVPSGSDPDAVRIESGSDPVTVRAPSGSRREEKEEKRGEKESVLATESQPDGDGNDTPRRATLLEQMKLIQGGGGD